MNNLRISFAISQKPRFPEAKSTPHRENPFLAVRNQASWDEPLL